MATHNVSNSSQLMSALNSASGGDVIQLSGGSYGGVSINKKFSGNVTITSDGNANISGVSLNGATNLTFDNVTFSGGGHGLNASGGSNITVQNCEFRGLTNGASFRMVNGVTVKDNYATDLSHDNFRFAGVSNVTISGNTYQESGSQSGYTHKDFIQFWTVNAGPSSDITITNNQFYSDDGLTHGIFMNGSSYSGGAFKDVYIANNYFKSSHIHGITVAHGNNVEIRNNTLIQDGKFPPLINVTPDSQYVQIIGNTAPSVPNQGNSTWTVSGNKETGGGTHWTGGGTGVAIANTGALIGADAAAADAATAELAADADAAAVNAESAGALIGADAAAADAAGGGAGASLDGGDVFRFSGRKLEGTKTTDVKVLDFADGDTLIFANYDSGTFEGGDESGTYAAVDTLAGLKALDLASDAVSVAADTESDVLTIEIDQGAATHRLAIAGMAQDYLSF